jgi:5-(aminomethyl)-3-furanmethanol phosphate kinase
VSPLVVKLGGRLEESGTLARWVEAVAAAATPIVVVPGGGAFAEAVRLAQARQGFDDLTAHNMALLAMQQAGLMLGAMSPRLVPSETEEDIATVLDGGKVPVWLPVRLAGEARDIASDWTLTSDGLAAWLAARIGARAVWLVKSVAPPSSRTSAAALAKAGIVDAEFARLVGLHTLDWRILGPGEEGLASCAADEPALADDIAVCRTCGLKPGFDE